MKNVLSSSSRQFIMLFKKSYITQLILFFQILAAPTHTPSMVSYFPLKTKMDWSLSSFTSKTMSMLSMETMATVQHLVAAMTFTSLMVLVPTTIRTLIWVTPTCKYRATNMEQVTLKVCSLEATISNPTRWKFFIRLTKANIR